MEVEVLTVQSHKEDWASTADELYQQKISNLIKFQLTPLKSKKRERDDKQLKIQDETESLMTRLKPDDFVVLCDETGKSLGSIEFSKQLMGQFDRGSRRVVFVIGGAFGVGAELKKRSQLTVSLSKMTMNHLVARVMLLEQIYRALMIWKNKPYHNE